MITVFKIGTLQNVDLFVARAVDRAPREISLTQRQTREISGTLFTAIVGFVGLQPNSEIPELDIENLTKGKGTFLKANLIHL